MKRFAWVLVAVVWLSAGVGCESATKRGGENDALLLRGGQRVLVLGDSISQDGRWVQYVDGYLLTRRPGDRIEIVNIGLSSETVSGLSEEGHPFPRPHAHDRVDAALERVEPDVVLIFYGMNDGVYKPLEEARFAAYREGMRHMLVRVEAAGARPILMTPPPFDAQPIADRVVSAEVAERGEGLYEGYDAVLRAYRRWLLSLAEEGYVVADPGGVSRSHVAAQREGDADYTLAEDGIHPGGFGHWLIAQAVLEAVGAPAEVDTAVVDAERGVGSADVDQIEPYGEDGLRFRWVSAVPMPMDPDWPAELVAAERVAERFNRHTLRVTGLAEGEYELFEGERSLGRVTTAEFETGVNMLRFEELTTNQRAAEIGPLVRQRQQMLTNAWREAVGYEFPHRFDALPLDEARAQAGEIERQIRDLAQPVGLTLRLVRVE